MKKKLFAYFFFLILVFFSYFGYFKFLKKPEVVSNEDIIIEENSFSSNTIKDVNYVSKDAKGNEYIINASKGEIDINDSDVIFLTNVKAIINLKNSNKINISSNYGKYNTKNFDTIFSKNVIITYLDNKITSEYLDFSIEKNLMIISKNIVYTNPENILIADVLEMDIQTKDTKIYMYESKKKINIKSKN
tara:strand:+ start:852 stop:1421 length:570 start_codon:yes stop_codon:yes gene_type:complete